MDKVEDLMKKAYDLGYSYEAKWGDCSQATIRALMEVYENTNKEVFKAMAGFHGGGGCEGDGSCGAYAASIYYLSMLFGRELEQLGKDPDDPEAGWPRSASRQAGGSPPPQEGDGADAPPGGGSARRLKSEPRGPSKGSCQGPLVFREYSGKEKRLHQFD